jgi:short-subunit dehydrogenase
MRARFEVAIITGASSGIGWSLAQELARQGTRVGLVARRREKLEELADEITRQGGRSALAAADVGHQSQVTEAIQQLARELGPVELLVANAGIGMPTLLNPTNIADVEAMFRINVLGMIYAFDAVLPQMIERRAGHLAGISSMASYMGLPGESAYCASKAAMNTYLEGLRIRVRDYGIAVSTICPGFVRTPMTEVNKFHMPWLLEADDAARRIVRALVRRKKVFNFPWQMACLVAITRWLPDWMLVRMMRDYNENPPMPVGYQSSRSGGGS